MLRKVTRGASGMLAMFHFLTRLVTGRFLLRLLIIPNNCCMHFNVNFTIKMLKVIEDFLDGLSRNFTR